MARPRGWGRWLIVGMVAVAILAVAGPYVYIHFVEGKAPKRLSLTSNSGTPTSAVTSGAADVPLDGTWRVAAGSQAGYRVSEILFGQNNEAVGRTSAITGDATISGTAVTAASVTVDLDPGVE